MHSESWQGKNCDSSSPRACLQTIIFVNAHSVPKPPPPLRVLHHRRDRTDHRRGLVPSDEYRRYAQTVFTGLWLPESVGHAAAQVIGAIFGTTCNAYYAFSASILLLNFWIYQLDSLENTRVVHVFGFIPTTFEDRLWLHKAPAAVDGSG